MQTHLTVSVPVPVKVNVVVVVAACTVLAMVVTSWATNTILTTAAGYPGSSSWSLDETWKLTFAPCSCTQNVYVSVAVITPQNHNTLNNKLFMFPLPASKSDRIFKLQRC